MTEQGRNLPVKKRSSKSMPPPSYLNAWFSEIGPYGVQLELDTSVDSVFRFKHTYYGANNGPPEGDWLCRVNNNLGYGNLFIIAFKAWRLLLWKS